MLPVPRQRRIQRQYLPHTMRVLFYPERLLPPSPSPARRVVAPEAVPPTVSVAVLLSSMESIPKPNGEVTRIGRGGYNLREILRWKEPLYNCVQVCTFKRFNLCGYSYNGLLNRALYMDLQTLICRPSPHFRNRIPAISKLFMHWFVSSQMT